MKNQKSYCLRLTISPFLLICSLLVGNFPLVPNAGGADLGVIDALRQHVLRNQMERKNVSEPSDKAEPSPEVLEALRQHVLSKQMARMNVSEPTDKAEPSSEVLEVLRQHVLSKQMARMNVSEPTDKAEPSPEVLKALRQHVLSKQMGQMNKSEQPIRKEFNSDAAKDMMYKDSFSIKNEKAEKRATKPFETTEKKDGQQAREDTQRGTVKNSFINFLILLFLLGLVSFLLGRQLVRSGKK